MLRCLSLLRNDVVEHELANIFYHFESPTNEFNDLPATMALTELPGFQTFGLFCSCEIQRPTSRDKVNIISPRNNASARTIVPFREEWTNWEEPRSSRCDCTTLQREVKADCGPACISCRRIQECAVPKTDPYQRTLLKAQLVDATHGPITACRNCPKDCAG